MNFAKPPFRAPGVAAAAFLSLAAPQLARAQSEPAGSLAPVEVRADAPSGGAGRLNWDAPSDTASRLGLTPRQTPAAVTVIDRAAIEARGAQNTQEILRGIPGVTAHDAPGSVGVFYRGFTGASLTQLFNGINVQYSIAARPVDSWIYDRVEAIGGASSFLYGAGGVGGTINYITKLPERGSFSEAQIRLGSDGLKEASFGLNRRIAGDGSGAGDHYVRIDLNHREGGAWTEGAKPKATQLAASWLADLGGGFSHTLAYEYQDEQVDRPYWGTPVLNPATGTLRVDEATRFKNYNSADGVYAQRVQWLRSISDLRLSDSTTIKNTFYVYDALRDYRNVEVYRFNAANTAVVRSDTLLQRHDHKLVGDRLEAVHQGTIAALKSDWAFGVDVSVNKQTRFPNSLTGVVSTVNPYHFTTENFFSIPGMSPGFNPDRDNRVETTAFYAENKTQLTPALSLVSALRHERIALELTNRRAVTAASPAFFERSYHPTTGRVGVVWDVAPGANLYAQYATAADPPAGILSTASFANVRDNSKLTTGRQFEVGAKADFWERKGNATVSVFHISRKNIATQDPSNAALTVLVGEQSSKGIELAVGIQPTRRWAIRGDVSLIDAKYEEFRQGGVSLAGKTPTNTPSTVANLWASYAITAQLQAVAGLRYVGKVYADAANTKRWPSYATVDVGLNYQFKPGVSVVARLRNATDKVYAANIGTMAYLGAPRQADVALRVAF